MQGNAQRAAMYQQVKNKPTLRSYPSAPNLPRWKTPNSLKSRGLSFGQLAPQMALSAFGAANEAGLFKGETFGGGGTDHETLLKGDADTYLEAVSKEKYDF